jgi:hypothetical protein
MGDLQGELRDVLSRRGEEVSPLPLSQRQVRRLRARQRAVILLMSLLVVSAAVGSVIAVRAVRSVIGAPDDAFPAAGRELARSVYVVEWGVQQYASTIDMVGSGPDGPRVIRSFQAGGAPTMALTPDGTRLYVVSGDRRPGDELVAFDVATGEVEMTARLRPRERLFRLAGERLFCCPPMELSPDGQWLFLLWVTPGNAGERTFYVATFDTAEGIMLPEMMPLDECEPGIQTLVPLPGIRRIALVCEESSDVRFFEASETGSLASSTRLELPEVPDPPDEYGGLLNLGNLAWATASPDRSLLYSITLNGHVSVVDLGNQRVLAQHELDLGPDRHVGYGQVHLSGTGESMYLGLGPMSDGFDLTSANQVMEVDTSTWTELRTASTPRPFLTFAVTSGADEVYVTSPRGLLRIDISTGHVNPVPGVGPKTKILETAG